MESGEQGELFVWLTAQDTEQLGVHPVRQGRSLSVERHALRSILQAAQRQLGFCPSQNLALEIMPTPEGCMMIFTPERQPLPKPARAVGPIVYYVADSNALLQLAKGLKGMAALPPSSLYRAKQGFYLLVYARVAPPLRRLLQETAVRCAQGDACAAYVEEYARACCIADALTRLRED